MNIFELLINLVLWAIVFGVLWWGQGKIAAPEPFNKIITVVLVLAVILVLIGLFFGQPAIPRFKLN